VRRSDLKNWQFGEFYLRHYERVSINFIVWFGLDFAQFGGIVPDDDEEFLSCTKPAELERCNVICGQSIASHFSFFPQNAFLERTGLLNEYRSLLPVTQSKALPNSDYTAGTEATIPDISRIELLRKASIEELRDKHFLEHELIPRLGLNTEQLWEYPHHLKQFMGGMLIWQYPNQFAQYLAFLSSQKIRSYLEIGIRWGGCFITTAEYLRRFNGSIRAVGIDLEVSPLLQQLAPSLEFVGIDSHAPEFLERLKDSFFDLIMIDGDHSYAGVKAHFELLKDYGRMFVFHDMVSSACPGVVRFWNELRQASIKRASCMEITDQYETVEKRPLFGIGIYRPDSISGIVI
jgi:hypothetical protein